MLWMHEVKHSSSGAGSVLGLRPTEWSARRDVLLPGMQKGVALYVVELDDQTSLFDFKWLPQSRSAGINEPFLGLIPGESPAHCVGQLARCRGSTEWIEDEISLMRVQHDQTLDKLCRVGAWVIDGLGRHGRDGPNVVDDVPEHKWSDRHSRRVLCVIVTVPVELWSRLAEDENDFVCAIGVVVAGKWMLDQCASPVAHRRALVPDDLLVELPADVLEPSREVLRDRVAASFMLYGADDDGCVAAWNSHTKDLGEDPLHESEVRGVAIEAICVGARAMLVSARAVVLRVIHRVEVRRTRNGQRDRPVVQCSH